MTITATEFKTNFGKYLALAAKQDIFVTKNGKVVVQVCLPQLSKITSLRELIGIAGDNPEISEDKIKEERLNRQ